MGVKISEELKIKINLDFKDFSEFKLDGLSYIAIYIGYTLTPLEVIVEIRWLKKYAFPLNYIKNVSACRERMISFDWSLNRLILALAALARPCPFMVVRHDRLPCLVVVLVA